MGEWFNPFTVQFTPFQTGIVPAFGHFTHLPFVHGPHLLFIRREHWVVTKRMEQERWTTQCERNLDLEVPSVTVKLVPTTTLVSKVVQEGRLRSCPFTFHSFGPVSTVFLLTWFILMEHRTERVRR